MVRLKSSGVLFTVTAISLLGILIGLALAYANFYTYLARDVIDVSAGERMNYISDDILTNSYAELTDVEIGRIYRNDSLLNIEFESMGVLGLFEHSELMRSYADFITNDYAVLQNTVISLENFTPFIAVEPFNSTLDFNGSIMTNYNPSLVPSIIRISAWVNESRANMTSNNTPEDTGDVEVAVHIYDVNSNTLMEKTSFLDPETVNRDFSVTFSSGSEFTLEFGRINTKNGALLITAKNLTSRLSGQYSYPYTGSDRVIMKSGSMGIVTSDMSRTMPVIIAHE